MLTELAAPRKCRAFPDALPTMRDGAMQVLVGRNNKENDKLSHKVAAETDLWFHARGFPGSHTVLRIPAGR